jgi:hypothetical protein
MPEVAQETGQSEIAVEFVRVDETTSYIDKCVGELETRLAQSILAQRKEANAAQSEAKNPEPVRVPLAQSLYEHGTRLENIRERLSSMLNRIEA